MMDSIEEAKKQLRQPQHPKDRKKPKKNKIMRDDYVKTIEVPKIVSWRKIRIWLRDRETKHGNVTEARVMNVSGHTQRNLARGYMIDPKCDKKNVRTALEQGFKCCFCEKSWKMTEHWELEQIEDGTTYEGFNLLCGKCWSKSG